ncbi:hypothetical protein GCM10027275_56320 [Rhabdobacter roseus]
MGRGDQEDGLDLFVDVAVDLRGSVFVREVGDINSRRLVSGLKALGLRPHVVLEPCIEAKSPRTLTALEAHQQSLRNSQAVFGPLLG